MILGVLGSAEDAFAPKKLFVGGLAWDTATQAFEVVEGTIQFGMAKAGQNADFTLNIMISSLNPTVNIQSTSLLDGVCLGGDTNDDCFFSTLTTVVST